MNYNTGLIVLFAGDFAPRYWEFCKGQLLQIDSYQSLYSVLGTRYGGDGINTFALPDLRGRVPVQPGRKSGVYPAELGRKDGFSKQYYGDSNLVLHSHTGNVHVSSHAASNTVAQPGDNIATPGSTVGRTFSGTDGFNQSTPNIQLHANSITVDYTGGNSSSNNMQPFLAMNFIIYTEGSPPSRQ